MSITPIPTRYASCHFRSRLEARWAVFFDTLGIAWEYEPEGYLVGHDRRPYLPDFWLPREKVWVEVKGSNDQLDIELTVAAALPDQGLPGPTANISGHDVRLLILGPMGSGVTRLAEQPTGEHVGFSQPVHAALTFRKGDLFQGSAYFITEGIDYMPEGGLVANDGPEIFWDTHGSEWGNLVGGGLSISEKYDEPVALAFRAARSARFEHGQSGA